MVRPTKTEKVARLIRKQVVARRQPGDCIPSMVDLAKRFHVSLNTVVGALTILEREGWVERRHGSGTYVTDRSPQHTVGLLVGIDPLHPRLTFFPIRTTQLLSHYLWEQGFQVRTYWIIYSPDQTKVEPTYEQLLEDIRQRRICGLAPVRGIAGREWVAEAERMGIPFVNGKDGGYQVDGGEVAVGIEAGACHLLEAGRRRIALMAWFGAGKLACEASGALELVLKEHGVAVRERWFCGDLHPTWAGAGYEEFKEIWTAEEEKPDGLLVCDDVLCADVAVAILEMGIRVPEQLLVVTHATKGSGIVYPFPTVQLEYDPQAHAEAMGQMLVKLVRHESVEPKRVVVPFQMVDKPAGELRVEPLLAAGR